MPSSYQVLKEEAFTLYYDFDTTTANATVTLAIVVTKPPFGWFGIGFGSSVMTNTDMFVAQIINGQVGIDDYYSSRKGRPTPDQNYPGGKSNWEFVDYNLNSSMWVVKVKRLVNTGDKYDFVLTQTRDLPICVSWGPSVLGYHYEDYLQLNIDFTQGAKGNARHKASPADLHTWLLLISWGFLIDFALIAARYMRGSNRYMILHAVFASGAVSATLGGVIQLFGLGN